VGDDDALTISFVSLTYITQRERERERERALLNIKVSHQSFLGKEKWV
jgi:hypothetical protein